ncbi:dipeptidyl-peptidase-like protein V precursor [Mytilinidion resinicola]|uniref:Dipeptidyl-peptidase V n=1 Tax=Mytilinidion resinicola TaxID=574789 RepID=A0A6A6YD14_9PEZI|nr:dipeptidyl-peptidase-like protein V precursor [Mytilinidion resinicola]KAF2806712.1 dipeptidyl-peptidase-like protein V precursor [Mytilinidion resinicola]
MTIRATKFTPKVLLSAPRRSSGVPNTDGSRILYSVSTYSFADHSRKTEIRVLDVSTQTSGLITDASGASEPNWLGDDHVLVLVPGDAGTTKLVAGNVDNFENSSYEAGVIESGASNLKLVSLGDSKFAVAVTAEANPKGELHNPSTAPKSLSSGKLYKSLFVRHWDQYVTKNRNSIWLGTISKSTSESNSHARYKLSPLVNALAGTGLESPIPPFGGSDHFDISPKGLIFAAKDPELNPATHTKVNVYLVEVPDFDKLTDSKPKKVEVFGFEGASTSTVLSPDGKQAAFLSMRKDGYEADKNQLFVIPDVRRPSWVIHAYASEDGKGSWPLSPGGISWSADSKTLYLLAEEKGRVCLFQATADAKALPELIMTGGAISDIRPLATGDVFVSSNSLIDNSTYYLTNRSRNHTVLSSNSRDGAMFGLSHKQIRETSWPGAAPGTQVHAWVVVPSTFNAEEKYPLAYLIHGGPQGSWLDSWSTRWNPVVFAEQGYVVVCPNPTGSTGYGQDFTDAIQDQWGGLPYRDIAKGFDWIEEKISFVDTSRAVALGASYGGYMMNWVQGQELGRKFKALVTHDGVFSMAGQMGSEELYFPFHEFKGSLWTNRESWLKWDPSRFTENWATPHLIVHSELDYRLTISEGLAAFNTLQVKGIESQFLTFPDENHWVLKPENSLLWHTVVLDWINEHVGLPSYSSTSKSEDIKSDALVEGVQGLSL